MRLTFQIHLEAAAIARWQQMSAAAKTTALMGGVQAAGLLVENESKVLSPYKTGTLRRSIRTDVRSEGDGKAMAYVGTDVPYARRLEFGFVGTDSLGRRYNQAARPYLRPALDSQKENIVREITAAVRDIIR